MNGRVSATSCGHHYFPDRDTDQEVVAKLAEMDFIVADLERANSRVAAVERRNVRLTLSIV
jgi:hypothetical protein